MEASADGRLMADQRDRKIQRRKRGLRRMDPPSVWALVHARPEDKTNRQATQRSISKPGVVLCAAAARLPWTPPPQSL